MEINKLDWASYINPLGKGFSSETTLRQALALVATIPLKRNSLGSVSAKDTLMALKDKPIYYQNGNAVQLEELNNILKYLRHSPRTELPVPKKDSRFSGNVPLILSAFREYNGTKYSSWDLKDPYMKFLVEDSILTLFNHTGLEFNTEELADIRNKALVDKNGNPKKDTLYAANKVGVEWFDKLPIYVKMCLIQVWAFKPTTASKYAITNLSNIDLPATYNLTNSPTKEVLNIW